MSHEITKQNKKREGKTSLNHVPRSGNKSVIQLHEAMTPKSREHKSETKHHVSPSPRYQMNPTGLLENHVQTDTNDDIKQIIYS